MTARDPDAWLRTSFAALEPEVDEDGASGREAVEPETIWAAVNGELDPASTAALVDRLPGDAQLAAEWRIAVALSQRPAIAEPANGPRYGRALLGLAAGAVACLLILIVPGRDRGGPAPDLEDQDDTTATLRAPIHDAAITTPITDGSALPRAGLVLRWSPVPAAVRYELHVTTAALDPVYRAVELREPRAQIPASALAALPSGATLLWRVEAVLDERDSLASPVWRVRVE